MTQEEKARAYDKTIERARNLHKDAIDMGENIRAKQCEIIFPELKESEDEKVRKEIIDFIYDKTDTYELREKSNSWLAWLEKQGAQMSDPRYSILDKLIKADDIYQMSVNDAMAEEAKNKAIEALSKLEISKLLGLEKQGEQKVSVADFKAKDWYVSKVDGKIHNIYHSVDKVEPKFKVGDYVVDNCGYLWRIEGIINQFYVLEGIDGGESRPTIEWVNRTFHLWTIEDAKDGDVLVTDGMIVLFKKRLENDSILTYFHYDTIDNEYESGCHLYYAHIYPATKEQCDTLIKAIDDAGYTFDFGEKELKKIHVIDGGKDEMDYCFTKMMNGEKVKPQSSTPMSYDKELEAKMHEACDRFFAPNTDPNRYSAADLFYAGVEAGCDLNTPVWSEEDEKKLLCICAWIKDYPRIADFKDEMYTVANNYIDWLKSIKDKYTWKPSDEQISALEHFVRSIGESGYASPYDNNTKLLYSLLEQLKKLKEE